MKEALQDLRHYLRKDEVLLRYLHYPPEDLIKKQPHPLSSELPDIVVPDDASPEDKRAMWDIIEKHMVMSIKVADIENSRICRIYIYYGKARPIFNNKRTIKQEIVIDVFTHQDYEDEMRLEMITDRLNTLLIDERPIGLGRMDYRNGYEFTAPKHHIAYRHIFETVRTKR